MQKKHEEARGKEEKEKEKEYELASAVALVTIAEGLGGSEGGPKRKKINERKKEERGK